MHHYEAFEVPPTPMETKLTRPASLLHIPSTGDEVPEGGFHGGQTFEVERGSEIGYHCHVYDGRNGQDLGIMLTLKGRGQLQVFAERHRLGRVKKPLALQKIGSRRLTVLGERAIELLAIYSEDDRRQPSRHAKLIFERPVI